MDAIEDFLGDPAGILLEVMMTPANLLKDAVAWAMGKLGFEETSEQLQSFDFADVVKNIIMAPARLLNKAVSWALDKLGFGADGTGEGDTSAVEEMSVTELAKKLVLAPWNLLTSSIAWLKDQITWDKMKSTVTDLPSPLKDVGAAIKGFAKSFAKMAVEKFSWLKYVIPDDLLDDAGPSVDDLQEISTPERQKKLTPEQTASAEAAFDDLYEEMLPTKVGVGNVSTAIAPAPQPPMVLQSIAQPDLTPQIGGMIQDSVTQADEMRLESERLQNTRAQQEARSNEDGNNLVVADNSVSNYTNYTQVMPGAQPSPNDNNDPFLFYRSAGNSR